LVFDMVKSKSALSARLAAYALSAVILGGGIAAASEKGAGPTKMSSEAKPAKLDKKAFAPDPSYPDKSYDAKAQIQIYGGKSAVPTPRPLVELGRPIYVEGPFKPDLDIVGRKNLVSLSFNVSGDWRTAVAVSDSGNQEVVRVATDLNLDLDLKLTATERVHALLEPFDQGGQFLNYQFAGDDRDQGNGTVDVNLSTLFFEGDFGSIYAGLADEYTSVDLPFSFGLMPLLFQNGIWMDDAFVGAAFAIPALNSPKFDISNMDITFFGGFDKVTTPAIRDAGGQVADHGVNIYGVTTYIESREGYLELGLGRVDGEDRLDDFSYNSASISYTRRYGRRLSNSLRAIWTFGQDATGVQQTADGVIFLVENSLITSLPSTLVPYFNAWVGIDRPQPLSDATGLLKNTGINFEADALTGFPRLDDTGHDTAGGAIGVEYLFALDQQIVVEAATVQVLGGDNDVGRAAAGDQYALGVRYQRPISPEWIVRADAMYGWLDKAEDISGLRLEIRRKF
jgi:hypothetical protein